MKKRFWLLGSRYDIPTVGRTLTAVLGVHLVEHESSYFGGPYLRGRGPGVDEVTVQSNFEDEEGYLIEAEFRDYVTLCYVTQDLGSDFLPNLNEDGIHVLRVEEL